MEPEKLYTRQTAAEYLQVDVCKIDREIKRGNLQALRLGKKYSCIRIRQSAINDYLDQCTIEASIDSPKPSKKPRTRKPKPEPSATHAQAEQRLRKICHY